MKIIQSFWTKPFNSTKDNSSLSDRSIGGYNDIQSFLRAISYSCLTLSKYYEVELVTDSLGKEILIDILNLPYSNCRVDLDKLNNYDSSLWALGKIYTYSIQDRPFLHIDNDVFIWKKFPKSFLDSRLIAQSQEGNDAEHYQKICQQLIRGKFIWPKEMEKYMKNLGSINGVSAYNAGVIGGNDLDFFKNYTNLAFKLINDNQDKLSQIDRGIFNIFFEQSLFYSLAHYKAIKVETLFNNIIVDNNSAFVPVEFDMVPKEWYIHTIGVTKKYDTVSEQIFLRLKYEYPETFPKIQNLNIDVFKNRNSIS